MLEDGLVGGRAAESTADLLMGSADRNNSRVIPLPAGFESELMPFQEFDRVRFAVRQWMDWIGGIQSWIEDYRGLNFKEFIKRISNYTYFKEFVS